MQALEPEGRISRLQAALKNRAPAVWKLTFSNSMSLYNGGWGTFGRGRCGDGQTERHHRDVLQDSLESLAQKRFAPEFTVCLVFSFTSGWMMVLLRLQINKTD